MTIEFLIGYFTGMILMAIFWYLDRRSDYSKHEIIININGKENK